MQCNVDGCSIGGKLTKGMCQRHYQMFWRHGRTHRIHAESGHPLKFIQDHKHHEGTECLKWPYAEYVRGYGQLFYNGRPQYAHRVMCIEAHGTPPEGKKFALHKCGKGHEGCVNPNHLYWGSLAENSEDGFNHGSLKFGDKNTNTKISEADVEKIRAMRGSVPQSAIAKMYGVSQQHICLIQIGKKRTRK